MAKKSSTKNKSTLTGTNAADVLTVKHSQVNVKAVKGNDKITVSKGTSNVLYGGAGNDTITIGKSAGKGNKVYGDAGNDTVKVNTKYGVTINGGAGNDKLYGGKGNDTFTGGKGKDTFFYANGGGKDTITDYQAGQDTLQITSGSISKTAIAKNKKDLVFNVGKGAITLKNSAAKTISLQDSRGSYTVSKTEIKLGSNFTGTMDATKYLSTVTKIDGRNATKKVNIIGNAKANTIYAGKACGTIKGGAGNDTINIAGGVNSVISGGAGTDTFNHTSGTATIKDYAAGETLSFADAITGVTVNGQNITLTTGANRGVTIENGVGKLTQVTEAGKKKNFYVVAEGVFGFEGSAADDIIVVKSGSGSIVSGKAGDDTLYGSTSNDWLIGDDGNDTLYGSAGKDSLQGMAGNDWLYGDEGDDMLVGGEGNDTLYGGDGVDEMSGGAGNDMLYGEAGDDKLIGGDGVDKLYGGEGDDNLYGEAGDDKLIGGDGVDKLYGGEGDDNLYGGAGGDRLQGGTGNDVLYGGAGTDIFEHTSGNDIIKDFETSETLISSESFLIVGIRENDVILLKDEASVSVTVENGFNKLTQYVEGNVTKQLYTVEDAADHITIKPHTDIQDKYFMADSVVSDKRVDVDFSSFTNGAVIKAQQGVNSQTLIIKGSGYNDKIIVNGGVSVFGYGGNDYLQGHEGDDFLHGGAGDDKLYGGVGNDELDGGNDNDTLYGGEGDDILFGCSGSDSFYGGAGDNKMYANDSINLYDNYNDKFYCGSACKGINTIYGFSSGTGNTDDTIYLTDGVTIRTGFSIEGSDAVATLSTGGTIRIVGCAGQDINVIKIM